MRFSMLEAGALVVALSLDAFVSSFSYGSNKIKIPFISVQTINIVCSSILGVSMLAGAMVKEHIPPRISSEVCFLVLFALGVTRLLDSLTKSFIRSHTDLSKEIEFSKRVCQG